MSEASEIYNSLPKKIRLRVRPAYIEAQLRQLSAERDRLERSFHRSINEINEHANNLQKSLADDLIKIKYGGDAE